MHRRWTVLAATAVLLAGACGDDSAETAGVTTTGEDRAGTEDLHDQEMSGATTTVPDPGAPVEPECPAEDGSSPRELQFSGPPPMCIDPEATYVALVETNRGDVEITLDAGQAPQTVNNFVFLARWNYYEGVGFHRVVPGFVVQGGDPFGTGAGGPGYQMGDLDDFDGELPTEEPHYPLMSVAMANAGSPSTNGSQFFIVTVDNVALDANYTRFGQVTAGEGIVLEIEASGRNPTPGTETPADLTVIEKVTITEQ